MPELTVSELIEILRDYFGTEGMDPWEIEEALDEYHRMGTD